MRPVPTRQMPLRRSDLRPEDNPFPDLRPDMRKSLGPASIQLTAPNHFD